MSKKMIESKVLCRSGEVEWYNAVVEMGKVAH